jgi:hypothetical protein
VEMVDRIAKQVLELDCGNSADHSSWIGHLCWR